MKQKLKTNRSAAKRFKVTGTGKVRFRRANRNHIRTKRSAGQVRSGRRSGVLAACDTPAALRMLGK